MLRPARMSGERARASLNKALPRPSSWCLSEIHHVGPAGPSEPLAVKPTREIGMCHAASRRYISSISSLRWTQETRWSRVGMKVYMDATELQYLLLARWA